MSLFSNFTGGDTRRSLRQAERKLGENFGYGRNALIEGRDQALGYLEPYQDGGESLDFYDRLLAGDEEAVRVAMENPMFSGQLQNAQNALLANQNARGMSGSGAAALAAARVNQDDAYRRIGLYGNRAQMGGQYAGMGAQTSMAAANALNQNFMGEGQGRANIQGQIGQTYNAGMNNLLGIAGAGIKAMGPGGLFGRKGLFG